MKKTILALIALLTFTLAVSAQTRIVLQNGQATNQVILNGGTAVAILNRVYVTNTFDSTSSVTTNLANYLRNLPVYIPTTTLGVAISGSHSGVASTNVVGYTFQRSWDKTNWLAWTNVEVHSLTTTNSYTNFNFTIGDYHYMRVYDISNSSVGAAPSAYWRSNRLELYYK